MYEGMVKLRVESFFFFVFFFFQLRDKCLEYKSKVIPQTLSLKMEKVPETSLPLLSKQSGLVSPEISLISLSSLISASLSGF